MTTRSQPPQFLPPLDPCNLPVRRCPVPRDQAARRILILRIGAFGDILMGTPLLAALRQNYPDAHLTWIVGAREREAVDASPFVDELLVWDGLYWKRMVRRLNYPLWLARLLALRRELRGRHYDVFVSFQPEEWPLLTLGVGAPVRVGIFDTFARFYGKPHHPHYRRLYTSAFTAPDLADHRTDQYLLTLQALGLPHGLPPPATLGYTEADRTEAGRFLAERGVSAGERLVVLAPMATWPTKRWPADRYQELGDALRRRHGCRVVLIGGADEREAVQALASRMACTPVVSAGDLTFRQMAALLDRASLLVSGDTGPMHAGSALGVPQVALFGATSPAWYGPRSARALTLAQPVPCGPCDQKSCRNAENPLLCLRLLSVEEVLEASSGLLRRQEASA